MNVYYMNGAGNDFMVIDARGQTPDFRALALKLCPITGADGFMAVDHSETADFKLHFYNSDGSRGEMCGNGARCICRFAYDLGIAPAQMTVETDAGIVPGWRIDENIYRVKLNNPSFTLACGTGTGSVACTMWKKGLLPGGKLTAHNPGGTLSVTLQDENGTVTSLFLEGPTQIEKIIEL